LVGGTPYTPLDFLDTLESSMLSFEFFFLNIKLFQQGL
jgi:hypothetical protein